MNSIRKWLYKPKKTDKSLLAQFYFADEELNRVATELDSFDSRKDPERCQALVTQLRASQDKVLTIVQRMMAEAIPFARTSRDFRVKFPDDVVQENLAGQLWFGAECLAAGSSIMNREVESASMRPLARALTKNLDSLRHILREQCLINVNEYTERIREALTIFDKLFAEFELSYVSAMVPVKSVKEYETIQEITVLFSETTIRAKCLGYITTDMVDEYDPALMFTIPRLAIVCGLLLFSDGPLNPDSQSWNMSDMFRPFQTLLYKIRELLFTLSDTELLMLERALCSQEEPDFLSSTSPRCSDNTSSATTATTAVQTDSPQLKKARPDDTASCSSMERLGSDCSDEVSLMAEEPAGRVGRTVCAQGIVCPLDRVADAAPSSSVPCESEGSAAGLATHSRTSQQPLKNLNKSDSNDSGLHSDAVSTSDSQFTISSSDSNQLICLSGLSSPLQNPSMDEVVEHHMEQSESESVEFQALSNKQRRPGEDGLGETGKAAEGEMRVCSNTRVEMSVSADVESSVSPLCEEGCACNGLAAEEAEEEDEDEESFYTPSSGVSPLHQPSADSAAVQAPRPSASPAARALQCLAASDASQEGSSGLHPWGLVEDESPQAQDGCEHGQRDEEDWAVGEPGREGAGGECVKLDDCGDEEDEDKENWESQGGGVRNAVRTMDDSQQAPQQLHNVLQKVQAIFAPSQLAPGELDGASDSCGLSDSPLTDTTLTNLTPPDATATPTSDAPLEQFSSPSNSCDSVMHCAAAPNCDSISSTLQTPCDSEPQNQNGTSDSGQTSDSGGMASSEAADASPAADGGGASSSAPSAVKMDSSLSKRQCDRCTQTPHSAINNDQSSKIHHHHHHHHTRQHSNPTTTGSTSSAASQNAPQDLAQKRQDGTKSRSERTDASRTTRSGAASSRSSQSQSQMGKKRTVEKSPRPAGSGGHGAKTRKTSHRTQAQKLRSLKSRLSVPESEARLKQYADNWSDCSSNSEGDTKGSKKEEGGSQQGVVETSSGSSGCEGSSSTSDCESDQDSCGSSETSSYNSESHDDEEIALAVQAAELANRNQARARFRSSSDMIHRLFVCISGVADQLQTNFAGDLRNILRVVFNLNCSEPVVMEDDKTFRRYWRRGARFFHHHFGGDAQQNSGLRDPPAWIPDDQSTMCMSCKTPFTFVRRRHHCRNCGKIFCGRCSSNAVSLPHFGHSKPVRVCNHCFVFQVNPFAMQAQI